MNSRNTQGPTTLFRVFVEDVNREELRHTVTEMLPSAHISYGEGIGQGEREADAVIEVYGPERLRGDVQQIAAKLKDQFQQQAVAIAEHSDRVSFYQV